MNNRHRCHGFTLLEVMIAVLVIAVGLLGLAGLQVSSLRNNHGAYLRSQASILAYDMLDRMRANADAADSGQYNVAMGGSGSGAGTPKVDVNQWQADIDRTLPDADGSINVDANSIATITIQWDDQLKEGNNEVSSFQFQTQITDD